MKKIISKDPYHQIILKEYPLHSQAEVAEKIEKAQKSFELWSSLSIVERQVFLKKCAHLLLINKKRYATLISKEMGKVITESIAEIEKCAKACQYYVDHAEAFLQDEKIESDAAQSYLSYDPLGIILAIMPWNFPFWQVFRFAAPTLMAGNVALLKHASNVPQCALAIETIFREAGFPEGVFQTLLVDSSTMPDIIQHHSIKGVTLTGSEKAGAQVASEAGKQIKKTVLELGGSDPFIVLKDANMENALSSALKSRMLNGGQSCIAAKRFLVDATIAIPFTSALVALVKKIKIGDPLETESQYACMARADLAQGLWSQVERSIQLGAKVEYGGQAPSKENAFFQPTVLSEVKEGMPAFSEELFGPVASIISFQDEAEALRIANATAYGLGASIWTNDTEKGKNMAKKIQSGAVFINGMVRSDPRLPFGGTKLSGYGRELSYLGIREFTNMKTIWIK